MAVVKEQVKSLKSEIDTLYEAMRNEIERRLFQSASHRCVAIPCATITSDTIVNIQERTIVIRRRPFTISKFG